MYAFEQFHDYKIHNVYRRISDPDQQKIINLWQRNQVISSAEEAYRRVHQVVCMITNARDEVVGVSTAYQSTRPHDATLYHFYRMFIQPGDRVPQLMLTTTVQSCLLLKQLATEDSPQGIIIVTENGKLMRRGARRIFVRKNCRHMGRTQNGEDIWLWSFNLEKAFGRDKDT